MRIRLVIKDKEYQDALAEAISSADKDVYIELGNSECISDRSDRTIVVTDYRPESIDDIGDIDPEGQIVFLTDDPRDGLDKDIDSFSQKLFKYKSITNILSDIELIDYMWNGESDSKYGLSCLHLI